MREVGLPVAGQLTGMTTTSDLVGKENKNMMGQMYLNKRERPRN